MQYTTLGHSGIKVSKLCRLKAYRRELLDGIHTEQKKLECLDYLIYQLRADGNDCCRK